MAGAAYRGVGIPACVAERAARRHVAAVHHQPSTVTRRGRVAVPSAAPPACCSPCRCHRGVGGRSGSSGRPPLLAAGGLGLRARLLAGWLAGLGCYAIGLAWARAFNWYGALVLVAGRGALLRRRAAALTPPQRGRALGFVGAFTLARGAAPHLALRGTAARGRVPRPGRRSPGRAGPSGRSAEGDRRRLRRGRRPGDGGRHGAARSRSTDRAGPSLSPGRRSCSPGWSPAWWWARRPRRGRCRPHAAGVALVQGGGQRGVSREDVPTRPPSTGPSSPPPRASAGSASRPRRLARGRGRTRPTPGRLAAGGHAVARGASAAHDAARRGDRAGRRRHDVSQRDRGLGTRPDRVVAVVREGAPGALRRVRARPVLLRPLRQPGRAYPRTPSRARAPGWCARRPARSA